ncbi:ABC transporter permease [Micromonospora craniellae]|uniref:ABC transporter permease n=1 Tax=Micromonospora craniellae TaxID=2294034 RepID=A0A372FQW9_9ACTN|nr:ABC transporter permease [Micromonospora craniellae]QOC90877.1 ABC transporter permease [Micromonospora craniellae]RFS41561.1 ABC transporter permease [Micromonospora craniellae]
MNRTLTVARLQFVAWPSMVGWPWGILALSFLINLALFTAMNETVDATPTTGGLASIYVVMFVACINVITQDFPFAIGLGVSRRSFYLGNVLQFGGQAIVYAAALYLLSMIEEATGGWGIDLTFFGIPFLWVENPVLRFLGFAIPFLLLGFLGIAIALVFKRWGVNGMLTLSTVALVVIGGTVVLATWRGWWSAIGGWFADQSGAALLVGWPALFTLPLAAASYLIIRRATP